MARYPNAVWRPCPKHGYGAHDTHLHQGVVIHSAEGSAAGLLAVLDDPNREASWHFHINKDGTVYQPVDTNHIAWTNGSREANQRFWGIENEGRAPEPLTEPQYQSLLALVKWLWSTYKLGAPKRLDNTWEHREMTRFGAPPTSCPGGRIPWARLIADMQEGDDMGIEWDDELHFKDEGEGLPKESPQLAGLLRRYRREIFALQEQVRTLNRASGGAGTGLRRGDTVSVSGKVRVE